MRSEGGGGAAARENRSQGQRRARERRDGDRARVAGARLARGFGAAALLVGFVVQERRASEPLLPPLLFRNDIFNVSSAMSFLMSMAMFGALVYLPFYFQIVRGATPTVSGLMLLPLMAGILIMSITSGRLVTRTGRYRIFPLLGTIVMTTGLITMTLVGQSTPYAEMAVFMAIFGAGMGMVMQNVILATQNAVDYSVMGTATSGIMFFRSLGAVFGTAMFGAIFVNRINAWLPRLLPLQARAEFHIHASASGLNVTPASVRRLPLEVQHAITGAVVHAIHTVFVVAVPFAAVSIVFAVRLRELPLRATSGIEGSKPGAGDEPPVELDVGSIV